jgi:hypothetical protein
VANRRGCSRHGTPPPAQRPRRQEVDGVWLLWQHAQDHWLADGPVLVRFADEQVEINHQKFDDLSLTWNTIDPVDHNAWTIPSSDATEPTPLRWRDDACPRLAALRGKRLCGVGLLRYTGSDSAAGMIAPTFAFAAERVTIANGLDENSIEFGQPPPDFVMMWYT